MEIVSCLSVKQKEKRKKSNMGKPVDLILFLEYFLYFPFSSLYKTSHFEWI